MTDKKFDAQNIPLNGSFAIVSGLYDLYSLEVPEGSIPCGEDHAVMYGIFEWTEDGYFVFTGETFDDPKEAQQRASKLHLEMAKYHGVKP